MVNRSASPVCGEREPGGHSLGGDSRGHEWAMRLLTGLRLQAAWRDGQCLGGGSGSWTGRPCRGRCSGCNLIHMLGHDPILSPAPCSAASYCGLDTGHRGVITPAALAVLPTRPLLPCPPTETPGWAFISTHAMWLSNSFWPVLSTPLHSFTKARHCPQGQPHINPDQWRMNWKTFNPKLIRCVSWRPLAPMRTSVNICSGSKSPVVIKCLIFVYLKFSSSLGTFNVDSLLWGLWYAHL